MTRSTLILAFVACAGIAGAMAQTSSPPRNDLPQPYRTTRDWGELPAGMKWAAVTSIEDMEPATPDHSGAEGVGVDAQGNVYGAVVRRQMLERHVKK
jgi:hypothetical protein